ncbi:hypothetical protein [Methylomonas methanica]|uniref:Uncharacterized protein n=1 Tax=Methylomonas methanica (strain DSM 25384 / MC09) TaxID=857087 RepID=G0A443_METMM|nr:hypothetical protein [Methylomonas methanica]AEF99090.1 hypothetical protein Metme_0647 [Methylomonas methanica MC09]
MCSSPKSSCSNTSSHARRKSAPMDYQAYAAMMRDASANFERVQAMKEARILAAAEQTEGEV